MTDLFTVASAKIYAGVCIGLALLCLWLYFGKINAQRDAANSAAIVERETAAIRSYSAATDEFRRRTVARIAEQRDRVADALHENARMHPQIIRLRDSARQPRPGPVCPISETLRNATGL